ncbi:ABC transporter permease [Stackebrandtia nassauensis]|uniref:Putative exporter of polyketide antibiotics-like protein n=1 Tax=Stackebrandtia nassauensis (strain DSM 44728 / CIP 108903 / NRRL B-16338 / NBRC 102104 / LLR-40K-21) TaxID=446470 RepID=D3Q9Z6_STANL|nr:putative exporter of polyketide antibiotics-like protein [Stackebrandtia nassauensis]ADD40708.1 Putative exporter of polyketide antibiotics- like protein [Stackebrandtia nassauensis DSM 44728]
MSTLTGTGKLIRLILRRDRFLLPSWVLLMIVFPIGLASGIREIYPSASSRQTAETMINASPAFTAMMGKVFSPTLGGLVAWRGSMVVLILGVICGLTVIRHTRADEEAGRRELVGSTVVGRHSNLAAALVVTIVASLVIGGFVAWGANGQDLDTTGSLVLGAQYAVAGIVFACLAGVCAQLTEGAGGARGIFFIVLGAAYMLRMGGDVTSGGEWMTWSSPAGWLEQLQPFADDNWYVLWYFGAASVALVAAAFWLSAHRDVEAGVFRTRLGRARARWGLRTPLALAWRLQRGALIGWSIGFVAMGALLGSMSGGIGDMVNESAALKEIFARLGGEAGLNDAFFAAMVGMLGIAVAGYSIQAALKARVEETGHKTEQLLATSVSRVGWTASHLAFAFAGPAVVLGLGGIAMAITYGQTIDDYGKAFADVLRACAVQLPAAWTLTGLATLLFGLLPRLLGLTWVALTACLLLGQVGEALQLPDWALDLSPFSHLPQVPREDVTAQPLLWLGAIVVATTVVGLFGFRRRDVG